MNDELRDRLIRVLSTDEWMERHFGIVAHAHNVVDALLPVIAEHTAAAVAVERERIAAGLQRLARHVMDTDIQEGLELLHVLASGRLPALDAAPTAVREERADG